MTPKQTTNNGNRNVRRRQGRISTAADAPNMSIQDTAQYLGVTENCVRTMISDGRLRGYRLGTRLIRLRRDEIDAALTRVDDDGAA